MGHDVIVEIVEADNWARIRSIRLRALKENPEAFGGTFEKESAEDEKNTLKARDDCCASCDKGATQKRRNNDS